MSLNKSSSYLRFLNLIDIIDRVNPGKKLDSIEENLLNKIVISSFAKQPILVGRPHQSIGVRLPGNPSWTPQKFERSGLH